MCESEAFVAIFLYKDMRNDYFLLILISILSQENIENKEFISKFLKILQLINQSAAIDYENSDIDNSFFLNIIKLYLKVLFWRDAEIMEISFKALYQLSNVEMTHEFIQNNLCEYFNDYFNIIDFVLQNSIRENLLKNLWDFLAAFLIPASNLTQQYLPILIRTFEKNFPNIPNYQFYNFTKILIALNCKESLFKNHIALIKNLKNVWDNNKETSQDFLQTHQKFCEIFFL